MTAPNIAENVCRGTPSQSAQVPYSRLSSIKVSPTSNHTARIVTKSILPSLSKHRELLVQGSHRGGVGPLLHRAPELPQPTQAHGVPSPAKQIGGLARARARLIQIPARQFDRRDVGEEHGLLFHRRTR